jgi:hypothetical protein
MKTWLVGAAKFFAEFLTLLAFFAAAGAFSATMDAPGLGAFMRAAAREAEKVFPWALALSTGLGIVSFGSGRLKGLWIFLSVCSLGALFGAAGLGARSYLYFAEPADSRALVTGQALTSGDRLVSVASIEGGLARRVAAVDFAAPFPRLLWASAAPFDGTAGLRIGGGVWNLRRPAPQPSDFGLPLLGRLPVPLEADAGLGPLTAMAGLLAFVLLCGGLATPALALRWPLASFIFALAAVAVAVGVEHWLGLASIRDEFAGLLSAIGLRGEGHWLVFGAEAILGLAVAGLGLLLARRTAE